MSAPNIITVFPEEIVLHIFSFSETYNVVNGAVCRDFRRIAPEVHPLVHLNHLLSQGKATLDLSDKSFDQVAEMVGQAISLQLLSILDACEDYLPANLCARAVEQNLVKVLYWTRSGDYDHKRERFPWYCDAESDNPDILEWMRKQGDRRCFV